MLQYIKKLSMLLAILLCFGCGFAENLQINDMSVYEDRIQEELAYFLELYAESDTWKADAVLLDDVEYAWIGESRELLNRFFADTYDLDISERTARIEVYASKNLPETIGGFSDGENHVYINQDEIERVPERMTQILLHEMLHALGIDFYWDESGMLSNGFFEGATEAAVQIILENYGYSYEDFSGYDEVMLYADQIVRSDLMLIFDLVQGDECDIVHRIDMHTSEGCGQILLECSLLLSTGPDAPEIGENCALIAQEYAKNIQ